MKPSKPRTKKIIETIIFYGIPILVGILLAEYLP